MAERKVNNAALAREIGLSHVAIGNYLKDQLPRSDGLYRLAQYFGVTMESFFDPNASKKQTGTADSHWKEKALMAEHKVAMLKSGMEGLLKKI